MKPLHPIHEESDIVSEVLRGSKNRLRERDHRA